MEQAEKNQGGIAPVDMLVSVAGRMVIVRAGQKLPSAAFEPNPEPNPSASTTATHFEQEDITETDPLPEPAPEPAPEVAQVKPKTKGAKK